MNEEIWYGVNPKLRLFRASGSTKYTSFIDIDIGIKELIIKTHLSITIRLLRQLSKPNRYVTFFFGTPCICNIQLQEKKSAVKNGWKLVPLTLFNTGGGGGAHLPLPLVNGYTRKKSMVGNSDNFCIFLKVY